MNLINFSLFLQQVERVAGYFVFQVYGGGLAVFGFSCGRIDGEAAFFQVIYGAVYTVGPNRDVPVCAQSDALYYFDGGSGEVRAVARQIREVERVDQRFCD